eukprot:COSAG02_NODE_157_length_32999_cov_31.863647_6_plen_113_part_00
MEGAPRDMPRLPRGGSSRPWPGSAPVAAEGLASGGGLQSPAGKLRGTHMLSAPTVDFRRTTGHVEQAPATGGAQARGPPHSERTSSDLTAARSPRPSTPRENAHVGTLEHLR